METDEKTRAFRPMLRTEACEALAVLGWRRKDVQERTGMRQPHVSAALSPAVPVKITEVLTAELRERGLPLPGTAQWDGLPGVQDERAKLARMLAGERVTRVAR